jgi:hypothetical protein
MVTKLQWIIGILLVNRKRGQCGSFFCDNRRNNRKTDPRHEKDTELWIVPVADLRDVDQGGTMADLLNLTMLICACVGATLFGILAAYALLRAGFALMRRQTIPVKSVSGTVKMRGQAARVS